MKLEQKRVEVVSNITNEILADGIALDSVKSYCNDNRYHVTEVGVYASLIIVWVND